MNMALPKYVRLADHLTSGMRADLDSGFSICGFDVVESPDEETNPGAAAYVKAELAAGRLEQASKAEYDETHPDVLEDLGYEVTKKVEVAVVPQEGHIQGLSQAAHRSVRAARSVPEEDVHAADEERRKAVLKEQKKAEKGAAKADKDDDKGSGTGGGS